MSNIEAPEMIRVVRGCLRDIIGYQEDLLLPDYKFRDFLTNVATSDGTTSEIELAAFAQSPPSYRSACFGVTVPRDESPQSIIRFRALGAPQILALHPRSGRINRWKIPASGLPERLEPIPFEKIASVFAEKQADWSPSRVLEAKAITYTPKPVQLDFSDIGLIPALEAELQVKLDRDITHILTACRNAYLQRHFEQEFIDASASLFRLLFRLIAAKLLIDGGIKRDWVVLDAQQVIREVEDFYFRDEVSAPALTDRPTQEAAWQVIRDGLNLQNLSVETLAYIYENTLVTKELRKQQSIHATPPEIADYMLRQLPLLDLRISERRVFEPFSGHAPFLISALGQMRTLLPKDISPQERHDYFKDVLIGMENEPFACEIARYALILADYPNGDHWKIIQDNAFTSPEFDQQLQRANIVLSNPPHEDFSPAERQALPSGASYNKAAEALHRVLNRQPPMFGFVLPRTFLDRDVFRLIRLEIAAHYNNVSVVVLPDKAFQLADQEVALLTAYKGQNAVSRFYSASVSKEDYNTFLQTGESTWEVETSALLTRENDVLLWQTPLQSAWDKLATYPKFDALANIRTGLRYRAGLIPECVSNEARSGYEAGVQTVSGYVENYIIRDYQYLNTNPQVMENQSYRLAWDNPKVIVNSFRTSRGYWSIAAAIDEQGLRASKQFHGIWPKEDTPLEILAALLNGPITNAYFFTYRASRHNQIDMFKQIPVPLFTEEQTELIVSLVQDYYLQRGQWIAEPELEDHYKGKCLELLYQIDAAVLEAYALPADLERELLSKFNGAERRPLPFNFPGYGEEYERAKEALQKEKVYRALLKQYHALVDKEFLDGLNAAESDEMERLRQGIDAYNAPFYERIFEALDLEKR